MAEDVTVWVEAINDDGDRRTGYGSGLEGDDAVQDAVQRIREREDDDSYVMNEWGAA